MADQSLLTLAVAMRSAQRTLAAKTPHTVDYQRHLVACRKLEYDFDRMVEAALRTTPDARAIGMTADTPPTMPERGADPLPPTGRPVLPVLNPRPGNAPNANG